MFFNQDILQQSWDLLEVLRFEPNYIISLKTALYNHVNYIFSVSDDELWKHLNNLLTQAFITDQILLYFLLIVTFYFWLPLLLIISLTLDSKLKSREVS